MIYYLLYKKNEPFIIGEVSYKKFWSCVGFRILNDMIDNHPDELEQVIIKSEDGKEISIDKFLNKLSKLKIMWGE